MAIWPQKNTRLLMCMGSQLLDSSHELNWNIESNKSRFPGHAFWFGYIKNISCFRWSDQPQLANFPKSFLGGCGYIYCKYAGLYKNILTMCMWRNGLRLVELVYLFLRTQAVSLVLPKICTKNKEGWSTMDLRFVSNTERVHLQCQTRLSLSLNAFRL